MSRRGGARPAEPMREVLFVSNITVPADRARGLDDDAVERLMESMRRLGLRTPVSVRMDGDDLLLVAGRHRLEAARRLGWERIEAVYVEGDETDARLWEISENLHRAALTAVERAEHIDEWRRLTRLEVSQPGTPGGKQPDDAGIRKTAQALGVSKSGVHRAAQIAALPEEVRARARVEEWTQDRLLREARGVSPIAGAPDPLSAERAINAQVKRLLDAWDAAGPDARDDFRNRAARVLPDRTRPAAGGEQLPDVAEDIGKVAEWLATRLDPAGARDLGRMLARACPALSRALLRRGQ